MADRDPKPPKLIPPPGCPDDEAPPRPTWEPPVQQNVYWRGGRKR